MGLQVDAALLYSLPRCSGCNDCLRYMLTDALGHSCGTGCQRVRKISYIVPPFITSDVRFLNISERWGEQIVFGIVRHVRVTVL